jgi:hypothetical protein
MPDKELEDIGEKWEPKVEGSFADIMEDADEILKQALAEYKIAEKYKEPLRKKWIRQMKLLENEKILTDKLGDETLYTIFDTVDSALGGDEMTHTMIPTEIGDEEKAELIENVMTYDYNKMGMEEVEDHWRYWTLFSGRAVCDQSEYNEDILACLPQFVNPFLEYVDPKAISMHGVGKKGTHRARFYGYELPTTVGAMEDMGIDCTDLKKQKSKAQNDLNAMRKQNFAIAEGDNEDINLMVWYTRYDKKNIRFFSDLSFKKIYKIIVLPGRFPLADRSTGISPVKWYPRSVPDLIEDKHKARANIMNSAMEIIREQEKPIYLSKEGNARLDLFENAESGEIIEVKDINQIKAMEKQRITQDVDWILGVLDKSSQEVTATPDIQQGVVMDEKRTLGELSMVASGSKNRYGKTARIFGRSMRIFWENWYEANKENWNDKVHTKMIRISGVYGPEWKTVRKPDITLDGDLDIRIESKIIKESKKAQEVNNAIMFHKVASALPTYDISEGVKSIGKKLGFKKQEINFLIKKTPDEAEAEDENIVLDQNKLQDGERWALFHINQDHDAHIKIHSKWPMTKAKEIHIEQHRKAMVFLKNNPDMKQYLGQQPTEQDTAQANTVWNTAGDMTTANNQYSWLPKM